MNGQPQLYGNFQQSPVFGCSRDRIPAPSTGAADPASPGTFETIKVNQNDVQAFADISQVVPKWIVLAAALAGAGLFAKSKGWL